MSIKILPYSAEHEEAVQAFNARLAAANPDPNLYSSQFPSFHVSKWLPKRPGCDLYQEFFVAIDDTSAVRGGYILKHQTFLWRGEPIELVAYQLPISEGIINRDFMNIGLLLYKDALCRRPYLWDLGGGDPHLPMPKFLRAAKWQRQLVPFWFRVVHPNAFLRNIAFLKPSLARRIALSLLKYSGLGWLGIKTLYGMRGKRRRADCVTCETVAEFSDWADDVWKDSKNDYSLIAVRDREILNVLYPATASRFIRLKITRNKTIIGWVVLLNTPMSGHKQFGDMRVGTLVDCLARPADASDVVACARDVLESGSADLIISNQCSQAWCQELRECGFFEGPSNLPFLASPKLAAQLQPLQENAATFHINRGDGDGPIHL